MRLSRTVRRIAATAAALGIALQALLPALAQARPADSIPVPICSADGAHRSIDLDLGRNRSDRGAEHCKLCLQGTDKPAVGGSLNAVVSFDACSEEFIERERSGHQSALKTSANPRAPPAAS